MPLFNDTEIERIFGADDAENETQERFLQYFYTNSAYDSLRSDLPIRIVVGHKGVGKSALLKRASIEDKALSVFSLWLKPNELIYITSEFGLSPSFIERIEAWKKGIMSFIAKSISEQVYRKDLFKQSPELKGAGFSKLVELVKECLKDSKSPKMSHIVLYIDDIDRGWSASKNDIANISALLNAMRDIASPDMNINIRFRIGLRSDVYFLVRTSDESTDKIERNVIWLKWSNDEILRIIAMRVQTYFDKTTKQGSLTYMTQTAISDSILNKVIEPRFKGNGHWSNRPIHNVLLSLTRARPRDIVKLLHGAAKRAYSTSNNIISSTNLESYFESYSQERLQDIINEFRSEMPNIEALLLQMKPTRKERKTAESFRFTTDQLNRKINQIRNNTTITFTNGRTANARSIIQFLYKIDFITARIEKSGIIERRYFDESRFLANEIVEYGYSWEIHPAYRWALQPDDIQDVISSLSDA